MISSYLNNQPFHIVEESPWPICLRIASFSLLLRMVYFFWFKSFFFASINLVFILFILLMWARDITRERVLEGWHTNEIEGAMKYSIAWFISSEVLFFFAFFWGFFTFRLRSGLEGGGSWPPLLIHPIEAFAVPLLNTTILLTSGVSLTWAHHALINSNWVERLFGLLITVGLGLYFTFLQLLEYISRSFAFNDSAYGSIFFISTGFHGMHVLVGTTLLLIVSFRLWKNEFINNHHIGLETARWYWHFVDVVWLFLFCCVYWWGA